VSRACRSLLPRDTIVDAVIAPLKGIGDKALLVHRFDRLRSGARIHFEEFNQLLGRRSGDDKYDAAYEDMASFIVNTPGCAPADAWRLYERVLVCLLTGNTDAHLKNFAMLHTPDGLRLTPAYDLVAAALCPEYRSFALSIGGAANLAIDQIKPKHLVALARACNLSDDLILLAVQRLDDRRKRVEKALTAEARKIGAEGLGKDILELMERRWNGSFSSIGRFLSKKRPGADEK
jgi:serine/threonine-protein kinase HipA